jgi:hypothetical protein
MKKRLGMAAFLAAIIGGWALAMFEVTWYQVTLDGVTVPAKLENLHGRDIVPQVIAGFVTLYFFMRLMFTGILVLLGGPTRTRKIAWFTPTGAHIQGGLAIAAAIVMVAMKPSVQVFGKAALVERSWGGPLVLLCALVAQVAIAMIARDPELAVTQKWPVDETPRYRPRHHEKWIHAEKQDRPMLAKAPLPGPANVDSDPFRAGAPTGLAAELEKQQPKRETPRADDKDVPGPKLLT